MYLIKLAYRYSPVSKLEFSPSQLLNSRHIKSKIPLRGDFLKPNAMPHSVYENMLENQKKQKFYYDKLAVMNEEFFKTGDKLCV